MATLSEHRFVGSSFVRFSAENAAMDRRPLWPSAMGEHGLKSRIGSQSVQSGVIRGFSLTSAVGFFHKWLVKNAVSRAQLSGSLLSLQEWENTALGICRCHRFHRIECDGSPGACLYPVAPTGYQSQRASRAERQPHRVLAFSRDSSSQWDPGRSRSVWLRPLMLCC